ncbi:oligomeric Golgi complex subunit 1 [Achaetomium macrosporum]|uniref:Conserved oligomeric Golgi complex subunit 1 n=1 Tax=Achaetomium macrosporum TaxID=79813 RepID=A0AAN7CF88_9PEZI|nr:oligomeric Golgi complex subunit 1 [Achaetomium macrosporum]
MANLPPNLDLSTLTSSADLFSSTHHPHYTLPQIRAIHNALQAQVGDIASRLRTQVGGSYRELLGTADTIVDMRHDMDDVLATLGGMGGRCGRGVVAQKVEGLEGFVKGTEGRVYDTGGEGGNGKEEGVDLGDVARGRLLEGCLLGLRGVLSSARQRGEGLGQATGRGERLDLAARLYVLGRLLVKSFGGEEQKDGAKLETARKSLETVHHGRLMRSVDAVLRSASGKAMNQGDVLKALSAYSLATSSGARDVLAHFLRTRAKAIAMALDADEEERVAGQPKDVLTALGLYTKTLQDVQTLVPHKLTEALFALKNERLLENASLKKMEGLRLDVYKRWCGDEIQFYTPFIRHDDLDGQQARELLADWAGKGSEVLLRGIEKTLESMTEFKAIVDLRTSVLKLWIAEGGKARGFDPSIMLNQLRDVINKQMLRVLEAKVAKLRLVGSEVLAALGDFGDGVANPPRRLWNISSLDIDLSNGASQFTQEVVARLYGRNDAVSKAVNSYRSWFRVIDDVGQVVDQLKRQRWDNDVDEIEDEETIEERQKLLSNDDPLALSEHLNRLLVDAFERLDDQLRTLWFNQEGGPNSVWVAMYFLRLFRDIRAQLPDLEAVKDFGLATVPWLQEYVARAIFPGEELEMRALPRKRVVGRSLWEGEPALPGSPSPGIFGFLRSLVVAMADAGADLWSPAAVAVLKQHFSRGISAAFWEALYTLDGPNLEEVKGTDGTEVGEERSAQEKTNDKAKENPEQRDLLVQWLMDFYYLRQFSGPQQAPDEEKLKELEDTIYQRSCLDAAARERLAKAAQDYFKRTALLFGLLI